MRQSQSAINVWWSAGRAASQTHTTKRPKAAAMRDETHAEDLAIDAMPAIGKMVPRICEAQRVEIRPPVEILAFSTVFTLPGRTRHQATFLPVRILSPERGGKIGRAHV